MKQPGGRACGDEGGKGEGLSVRRRPSSVPALTAHARREKIQPMASSFARRLALLVPIAALVVACSEDGNVDNHDAHADHGEVGCSTDQRVSTFAAGLSAQSPTGQFAAELVNADPAPPHKGDNDWIIKFTAGGQPFDGDITVATRMPDHGHGSPRPVTVTKNDDGTHTIGGLYLFMGGVWTITFAAEPSPGQVERAEFTICVQ
jgi:hypothetical protein